MRGHDLQVVLPEDDVEISKFLSDRRQRLVEPRIAAVNRLRDVLQNLVPGRDSRRLTASKALAIPAEIRPTGAVTRTRKPIAQQHAHNVAKLDVKAKAVAAQIKTAVDERPSKVDEIFGIEAIGTALILGCGRRCPTVQLQASVGQRHRHRTHRGQQR